MTVQEVRACSSKRRKQKRIASAAAAEADDDNDGPPLDAAIVHVSICHRRVAALNCPASIRLYDVIQMDERWAHNPPARPPVYSQGNKRTSGTG